jgi:hypothetical protein
MLAGCAERRIEADALRSPPTSSKTKYRDRLWVPLDAEVKSPWRTPKVSTVAMWQTLTDYYYVFLEAKREGLI